MRTPIAGAGLLVLLLLPRAARADDEKAAAERFREGRRAFEAHDYQRAATEFEAANRAKPAPAALLSAGLAWELGGDLVNAALDLADALARGGLEPRDEATARRHLMDLDAKLGHVSVRGAGSGRVSIDGHLRGVLPLDARVMPGNHEIELQPDTGPPIRRSVNVSAGGSASVDVSPQSETRPVAPTAAHDTPVQRTLGWVSIGFAATAFVAGAITGSVGLAARNDFVSGGDTSQSLHDEAVSLRTAANVLWIGAGVFAITGVVLVLTAPRATSVTVGVGPSTASFRVTF